MRSIRRHDCPNRRLLLWPVLLLIGCMGPIDDREEEDKGNGAQVSGSLYETAEDQVWVSVVVEGETATEYFGKVKQYDLDKVVRGKSLDGFLTLEGAVLHQDGKLIARGGEGPKFADAVYLKASDIKRITRLDQSVVNKVVSKPTPPRVQQPTVVYQPPQYVQQTPKSGQAPQVAVNTYKEPRKVEPQGTVPPEQGGPGFTGEGWESGSNAQLGDSRAQKGGTIVAQIREWPGNLRMAGTGYNTWLNYTVRDLCYMSLLALDPNTLDYMPGLASHWQISEDKMTYRFRINPEARWSDGMPVVAQDVVASWKLRMDPTLQDPSAILTYGKLKEPVAISKYIVEVTAKDLNWRNFLYFGGMSIFPNHEIGQITGKEYLDKYNYAYTAFSGPYLVHPEDIDKGNSLTLTRRDDWWAKDEPQNHGLYNFDRIQFIVVTDPELAFQKACVGEIDYFYISQAKWWAEDLPSKTPVKKGWLVRQKIYNDAPVGTAGFAINQRNPPLNDVRIRKALQYLYNREKLIEALAYNEYLPLDSYYQGGEYQNPDNQPIRFDPRKAVELLNEAGWSQVGPDGIRVKDGKRLSLKLTWYNKLFLKYLTSYKEDCAKVGVEIALDQTNPETLWKNLMERKFEMVSIGWGALIFPNPETSMHSKLADQNDNNNITGFKNERCDELFKKYDVAFTQEERRAIIREVDGLIYQNHPYVLQWYQPCQRVMYWNKFGVPEFGFHRTLEWEDAFASWWIDKDKEKTLAEARRTGSNLTVPPLEIRYWEKNRANGKAAE